MTDFDLMLLPRHEMECRPADTTTREMLNWIDLMERALERKTPAPVASAAAPQASAPKPITAKNLPGSKVAPTREPQTREPEQPAVLLLRFLAHYEHEHGQMPTYQEINNLHLHMKYPAQARYCVVALEKAGLVHLEMDVRRGIRITTYGREVLADTVA